MSLITAFGLLDVSGLSLKTHQILSLLLRSSTFKVMRKTPSPRFKMAKM
jgi:hypothetical protein